MPVPSKLPVLSATLAVLFFSCGSSDSEALPSGKDSGADQGGSAGQGTDVADYEGTWGGMLQGVDPNCPEVPFVSEVLISIRDGLARSEGSDIFDFLIDDFDAEVEISINCDGVTYFTTLSPSESCYIRPCHLNTEVTWDRGTEILSIGFSDFRTWRPRNQTGWPEPWSATTLFFLDLVLVDGRLVVLSGKTEEIDRFTPNHDGKVELTGELLPL